MSLAESLKGFFSIRDARIWQKLVLACGSFLIPVGIISYFLLAQTFKDMNVTKSELLGAEYLKSIHQAAVAVMDHRRLSYDNLEARGKLADLEAALKKIQEADNKIGQNEHTGGVLKDINELVAKLKSSGGKGKDGFEAQNTLLNKFSDLMIEVTDVSQLNLESSFDAANLQRLMVLMIKEANLHGQVQLIGSEVAKKKQATPEQTKELVKILAKLELGHEDFESSMEDITKEAKELEAKLSSQTKAYHDARDANVDYLEQHLTNVGTVEADSRKVSELGQKVVDASNNFFAAMAPQLDEVLRKKSQSLSNTLWLSIAAILGGLLLTSLIAWLISRSITKQLNAVSKLFNEFSQGNYKVRAEVLTRDELGQMAEELNKNVLPLVQSHDERAQLQQSIMKLLDDVGGVADGDLTKEAEVTADATGAIADSFNNMITQLRGVIGRVQEATLQVSTSANEIQATAEHLSQGTEQQTEQIVNTSAAIDEMAVSIQQVAENAGVSSQVATHALDYARKGNAAVHDTMEGMVRIRDQVQETAKRLKRLGESSQEIGSIIQLIDDISDRTSILALNASIQAAAAGDAGRGFAVVAEEIERLAERSAEATKKISGLIKTIQSETSEAVNSMDKSITEVVEGSKVANQAGQSLNEISTVSTRLSDLIQQISMAAKQQARGSDALAKSMSDISQITQQTAVGTKQAAESVNQLAVLADELRNSLNTFKLPGKSGGGRELPAPQPMHVTQPRIRNAVTKALGRGNGSTKDRSLMN